MGITRKVLSVTSLGLVDFRSDKERTAAYTRGTRKAAREQTKLLAEQNQILARQQVAPHPTAAHSPAARPVHAAPAQLAAGDGRGPLPAGWYVDPSSGCMRWWDGAHWTQYTQPLGHG
jgi:hypothetical protein